MSAFNQGTLIREYGGTGRRAGFKIWRVWL